MQQIQEKLFSPTIDSHQIILFYYIASGEDILKPRSHATDSLNHPFLLCTCTVVHLQPSTSTTVFVHKKHSLIHPSFPNDSDRTVIFQALADLTVIKLRYVQYTVHTLEHV